MDTHFYDLHNAVPCLLEVIGDGVPPALVEKGLLADRRRVGARLSLAEARQIVRRRVRGRSCCLSGSSTACFDPHAAHSRHGVDNACRTFAPCGMLRLRALQSLWLAPSR